MWITREMARDFEENITWNPLLTSFMETLEAISDALALAGYGIEINKMTPTDGEK